VAKRYLVQLHFPVNFVIMHSAHVISVKYTGLVNFDRWIDPFVYSPQNVNNFLVRVLFTKRQLSYWFSVQLLNAPLRHRQRAWRINAYSLYNTEVVQKTYYIPRDYKFNVLFYSLEACCMPLLIWARFTNISIYYFLHSLLHRINKKGT